MSLLQGFRIDFRAGLEAAKLVQVDFIELHRERHGEAFTTNEGQPAEERQVAALAVQPSAFTGASVLALLTPAGGLALTGRDAVAHALAVFLGARVGHKVVQFHRNPYSSTLIRWTTLFNMPRMTGVSLCSTV